MMRAWTNERTTIAIWQKHFGFSRKYIGARARSCAFRDSQHINDVVVCCFFRQFHWIFYQLAKMCAQAARLMVMWCFRDLIKYHRERKTHKKKEIAIIIVISGRNGQMRHHHMRYMLYILQSFNVASIEHISSSPKINCLISNWNK